MNILPEVLKAQNRLRNYIIHTPLIKSQYLSQLTEGSVYLKLESEQYTGSFKARGSMNKLLTVAREYPDAYCITASTGNHGRGVARALTLLGMKGKIVVPENAVSSKVEALNLFDVEVEVYGRDCYESEMYAKKRAQEEGLIWVSPYNDPQVIGGQGTIATEIMQDIDNVDNMLVTVGGGGMISGIASYMKAVSPGTQIIGCQPENSPEMALSVRAGTYQEVESRETLSDGSAGGFERDSITFRICKEKVDEFQLVSEQTIADSIRLMLDKHSKVIEGAAGVALGPLLDDRQRFQDQTTVIVICGANISSAKLASVITGSTP